MYYSFNSYIFNNNIILAYVTNQRFHKFPPLPFLNSFYSCVLKSKVGITVAHILLRRNFEGCVAWYYYFIHKKVIPSLLGPANVWDRTGFPGIIRRCLWLGTGNLCPQCGDWHSAGVRSGPWTWTLVAHSHRTSTVTFSAWLKWQTLHMKELLWHCKGKCIFEKSNSLIFIDSQFLIWTK
jgi:hypothetical protein